MRGRKPAPARGALNHTRLASQPRCPPHLGATARREWRRLATPLFEAGILTLADRAALAAYCQAWERWVEAEQKLKETPPLLKTPSGYVQQSPWISIANKQLELMGRFMTELGLTPTSRTRVKLEAGEPDREPLIVFRTIVDARHGDDPDIIDAEYAPDPRPEARLTTGTGRKNY